MCFWRAAMASCQGEMDLSKSTNLQKHSPELTRVDMNGKKKQGIATSAWINVRQVTDSRLALIEHQAEKKTKKNIAALNKDSKILSGVEHFLQLHAWRSKKTEKEETLSLMMSVMFRVCACDFCHLKSTHKPAQTFQRSPVWHKDPVRNCSKPGNIKNSCCWTEVCV